MSGLYPPQPQRQYPPTAYDPRMVNTARLADVSEETGRLLGRMLAGVVASMHGPQGPAGDVADALAATVGRRRRGIINNTNAHEEEAALRTRCHRARTPVAPFAGYSPQQVYLAVLSSCQMGHADGLRALLEQTIARGAYADSVAEATASLQSAMAALGGDGGNGNRGASSDRNTNGSRNDDNHDDGVSGSKKKRPRLSAGEGSRPVDAVRDEMCYRALLCLWRRLVPAAKEIQTVWAPYTSLPASCLPPGGGGPAHHPGARPKAITVANTTTTACDAVAVAAPGIITASSSSQNGVLGMAMSAIVDGPPGAPAIRTGALRGYVAALIEELAASVPVPPASNEANTANGRNKTAIGSGGNEKEEAEESSCCGGSGGATGEEEEGGLLTLRGDLVVFTDLCTAARWHPEAVPLLSAAVSAHAAAVARRMLAPRDGVVVTCVEYFGYVERLLAGLRARVRKGLLPAHAEPELRAAAEQALLSAGPGADIVARDFAAMYDHSALTGEERRADANHNEEEEEGKRNGNDESITLEQEKNQLATVWRVLSRSVSVKRDHVVRLFRRRVDSLAEAAVKSILALQATPIAPALHQQQRSSDLPAAALARSAAVLALFDVVRRARRVTDRCFPLDHKQFRSELDQAMQAALAPHDRAVAEALAAFVDIVFRQIEVGDLALHPAGGKKKCGNSPTTAIDKNRKAAAATADAAVAAANDDDNEEDGARSASTAAAAKSSNRRAGSAAAAAAVEDGSGEDLLLMVAHVCSRFPSLDLFQQLHWRDMGRRLLHPYRSVNLEAERCFLRIFEGICGNGFISKFEHMLRDMDTSGTLTGQYRTWVETSGVEAPPAPRLLNAAEPNATTTGTSGGGGGAQGSTGGHSSNNTSGTAAAAMKEMAADDFAALPRGLEVTLHFLSSGLWPGLERGKLLQGLLLPPPMRRVMESVELFYRRGHPQRIVSWQHQLSYGVLKARLTPGGAVCQLSGTLLQCLVLMHLDSLSPMAGGSSSSGSGNNTRSSDSNATASVSMEDLCAALGVTLESPEMVGSILGLCHDRFGLLFCEPSSSPITPTVAGPLAAEDRLRLNAAFTFASSRVCMPFKTRVERVSNHDGSSGGSDNASFASLTGTDAPGGGGGQGSGYGADALSTPEGEDAVFRRHGQVIEAALIQFMKRNGTATHEALATSLRERTFPFPVSTRMVKMAIDKMIDRGYLERVGGGESYRYLA